MSQQNDKSPRFVCKYCNRPFVLETRYMQHQCDQMKRTQLMQTPIGQAAWQYYQHWMRAYKRMAPSADTFLTSRYFNTFVKFATHANQVQLPHINKFIWLMKEKDIQPTLWTNDQVYSMYIEFIDRNCSPIEQASLSVNTLLDLADHYAINVSDIFDRVTVNDIIQLIRIRQLSPWLLLCSRKFKIMFAQKASQEQQVIIETVVRPDYWVEKFEQHEQQIKTIKLLVDELGI